MGLIEHQFCVKAELVPALDHAVKDFLIAEGYNQKEIIEDTVWGNFLRMGWDLATVDPSGEYGQKEGQDITEIDFVGEKYHEEQERFMRAIAPYVEDGSYLIVEVESDWFKWTFEKGVAMEYSSTRVFNTEGSPLPTTPESLVLGSPGHEYEIGVHKRGSEYVD